VLIEESITRTINIDKKSTDEWQRWVAVDASGGDDRMMHMGGGEREWVTGANVLRAQSSRPGKIYMASWDWSATMYREETGSRLSGRTQGLGVDLQRLRSRPEKWQRKGDRQRHSVHQRLARR
jgi:hypothetical protein